METQVYIGMVLLSIEMNGQNRKKAVNNLVKSMLFQISNEKEFKSYKTDEGKPVLTSPEGWNYNISHSKNIAVCSICNTSIGVDIERIKLKRDFIAIANTWFHPEENRVIKISEDNACIIFYHLWTRKESWIKEKGKSVWSMKKTPNMNSYHNFVKTWDVEYCNERYSLSISLGSVKNSNRDISIDFMNDFTVPDMIITPYNLFIE